MERDKIKQQQLKNEKLVEVFELVDYYDDWRYFSKPYYYYINKDYRGDETIIVVSSPKKILDFLKELSKINSYYLRYIKEFELRYWIGNKFRGWGGDASRIIVDKEFANKIKLKGYYEWIDRAWGDYTSELQYDLSKL